MFKKILCLSLCLIMLLGITACKKDGEKQATNANSLYSAELKSGTPKAPGDVFDAPDIGESSSSVTLGQATAQAYPDDSVIVMGEGFEGSDVQAYVYAQTTKDNGKAHKASFYVTEDQTAAVTIDKSLDYGLYGIYFEAGGKKSNILYVNQPKIWWVGLTELTAGDELKIFGENLTTDNKNSSNVYLVSDSGKYCELKVTFADPYKVVAQVPQGLEDGAEYEIWLHNGHGGDLGFAKAEEKMIYSKDTVVSFGGETLDVTDFGAVAGDDADDSQAVQDAVNAAADGDIVYFPAGKYNIDVSVYVDKAIKFKGFEQKGEIKSTLVMGQDVEEAMIEASVSPFEITCLNFWDVRQTKLQNAFIHFDGDAVLTSSWNVYIHNCNFTQQSNPSWNNIHPAIKIERATQVVIEDNNLEVSQFAMINIVQKAYINNNVFTGTYTVVNPAVNANALLIWSTDKMESYGNNFYSRHNPTDKVAVISLNNYTNGRSYALQNYTNNLYISHNEIVGAGIPNANIGEQIMFENGKADYLGGIASATKDTITLPKSSTVMPSIGDLITLSEGKGKGQIRYAVGYENGAIVLNEPLNIVPDSTTVVNIVHEAGYNAAIHGNKMIGYSNYYNDWGATCGVQIYSNNVNIFVTDNDFSYMCYGVCISPHGGAGIEGTSVINGTYWILVQDNKISEVDTGIRFNMPATVEQTWETAFGVAIRRNTFDGMFTFSTPREGFPGGEGITMGQALTDGKCDGDWINSALIENNVFKGCYTADLYFYPRQDKTILRNNTSDRDGEELKITVEPGSKNPQTFK